MKKRLGSVLMASTLGLGGLAAGVALAPAIASATDGTSTAAPTAASAPAPTPPTAAERTADRTARLRDDLSGLVKDGTLTQQQADKVADTLASKAPAGGRGGPGGHRGGREVGRLDAAAKILGVGPEALRTELQGGKSLADVATEKNISKDALINGLVTQAETRLADRVKSGDITQAQADQRKADLRTRITTLVDRKGLPARPDHGDRGPRGGDSDQPTG
ncbi:MAG: hypothetical protein QOJ32_1361 [Frankiaceae bacterium]|jgi:hypothetical protein|nr:hypothetical protein [Frankiaceae bacterium]